MELTTHRPAELRASRFTGVNGASRNSIVREERSRSARARSSTSTVAAVGDGSSVRATSNCGYTSSVSLASGSARIDAKVAARDSISPPVSVEAPAASSAGSPRRAARGATRNGIDPGLPAT